MKRRNLIILVTIIVLYLILSFFIDFMIKRNNMYIVFPDNINLKYEKKWKVFSDEKTLNYKYEISKNGNVISSEKLTISNGIISGKNISLENDIIAYRGTKISNISYQNTEFDNNDYNYLSSVLNKKNINIDIKLTSNTKYQVDLNNDGTLETIYSVSNNYDIEIGKLFSIIVIKESNEIIQYSEFNSEYNAYIPCIYFVDINKDKNADMIIKNIYSSLIGQDIKIVSFEDDLSYNYIFEEEIR